MRPIQFHLAGWIDQVVRDYFSAQIQVFEIRAKDLMPLFVQKGIFLKDYKKGFPIRKLLRLLDKEDQLGLLVNCSVKRCNVNRQWFFVRNDT